MKRVLCYHVNHLDWLPSISDNIPDNTPLSPGDVICIRGKAFKIKRAEAKGNTVSIYCTVTKWPKGGTSFEAAFTAAPMRPTGPSKWEEKNSNRIISS
jgi:hypothetical protein